MIFEGAISIKAIIEGKKRHINWLMIDEKKDDRNTRYIISIATKQGIDLRYKSREEIDELANGKSHGGIIMDAENRINDDLNGINLKSTGSFYLIEGIEDPFNLGYAIRSLYAFGAKGLIIKNQHLINSENIIVKSSAGASEKLPIIVVESFDDCIKQLKKHHYKLVIAERGDNSIPYDDYDFTNHNMIAIGGEKRGLSKEIIHNANYTIYIPYANDFRNALNLTSALVTIASEVNRQKRKIATDHK